VRLLELIMTVQPSEEVDSGEEWPLLELVPSRRVADWRELNVLIVCTANQCRSPLMEFALRKAARHAGLSWTIQSAGVEAVENRPADRRVRQLLETEGEDLSEWRSRQLTLDLVSSADLVLTATRSQRSFVASTHAPAVSRTFTFLQFAAYRGVEVAQSGVDDDITKLAVEARARIQPSSASWDIADPFGKSLRHYRRAHLTITRAAMTITTGRA
jgi:protein-tyrosine phosphatase